MRHFKRSTARDFKFLVENMSEDAVVEGGGKKVPHQFKNNCFTEICSGSEAGSYLRRTDFCITQL